LDFCFQEGREIVPRDAEEFAIKQEFVQRITAKTNLKAEEETSATTTLDFVSKHFD
jgi:hypothetical protein